MGSAIVQYLEGFANNSNISYTAKNPTSRDGNRGVPMTQILDSANEMEAEMAGAATACLVAALDHSKADKIKVTIEVDGEGGEPPVLFLPPRALRFFADVLRQMAKREPMTLVPQKSELTTQQAAAFLNVSRPFVIKEVEAGRLKCRLVNRHRRIEFEELIRYQREQKLRSEAALKRLSDLSQEMGEEL
jgi:excisionase family DNA binding protein